MSEPRPDDRPILVDTSAWVEFLRGTGSRINVRVRDFIESGARLATTDVVVMELLAGARSESRSKELRRFLLRFEHLPSEGLADFEKAAGIYRTCRQRGSTVRSLFDCLISIVAIREGIPVLAHDRDFEAIADHTPLEVLT